MAQATSVHSTPPTNTSASRRRFLSVAATLAAGSAALALAIPPAVAAADPVYALIETHKAMTAAPIATLDEKGRLEDADLPFDESLADAAHDAEDAALTELVEAIPTTLGGVIASMNYITEAAHLDHYRYSEEELGPLIANLCEALKSLSGSDGGEDGEG
jgi:hypothetical protein